METIRAKLRQHKGTLALESALMCLGGVMLLVLCLEIARVYITVNAIKSKTDSAVLTVAAANVENVYDGVREGSGAARTVSDGDWSVLVSTDEVKNSLMEILSLTPTGEALERISPSNRAVYRLSGLNTSYVNSEGNNLNFKTIMTVTIPLSFLGLNLNQKLEVSTTYDAKF